MRYALPEFAIPAAMFVAGILLSALPAAASEAAAACRSWEVNVRHNNSDAVLQPAPAGNSICIYGERSSIRLEVHQHTAGETLSLLLAAYNVAYRSSVPLTEDREGTYVGSLGQVIARLLDGYDYVITHRNGELEIAVLAKKGEKAIPSPIATSAPVSVLTPASAQISENIERPPVHGSRGH